MDIKNPDKAIAPVIGIAEQYEAGIVAEHAHARAQLIYAVSGLMTVTTKSDRWVLPPTRALWIPGNVRHSLKISRAIELRTLYIANDYKPITLGSQCSVISVTGLVCEIVLSLVGADWNYSDKSAESRLAGVLGDQLNQMKQEPVHLPKLHDKRAKRFAAFFYENPAERRSIRVLSEIAGVSPRTLARLFEQETGLGISEWCQQFRLLSALEKISGGTSVAQAAFEVGYENPSSFIAVFRKTFGITPARFFRGIR